MHLDSQDHLWVWMTATPLLACGAVTAGLFAAVGGRRRVVPNGVPRAQRIVSACLLAVAGYPLCYVAYSAVARMSFMADSARAAGQVFVVLLIIFIFATLAGYLARVTNEPRTLKSAAGSSIALVGGWMVQIAPPNLRLGVLAGWHEPGYFAQAIAMMAVLALISLGPAIILAELAQLWMDRASPAQAGDSGRQIIPAEGEALG